MMKAEHMQRFNNELALNITQVFYTVTGNIQ